MNILLCTFCFRSASSRFPLNGSCTLHKTKNYSVSDHVSHFFLEIPFWFLHRTNLSQWNQSQLNSYLNSWVPRLKWLIYIYIIPVLLILSIYTPARHSQTPLDWQVPLQCIQWQDAEEFRNCGCGLEILANTWQYYFLRYEMLKYQFGYLALPIYNNNNNNYNNRLKQLKYGTRSFGESKLILK